MKKILDVKTLACPEPVIQAKKMLEDENITVLDVVVGNLVAKENIKRLANSLNFTHTISEIDDGFLITISKNGKIESSDTNEDENLSKGKTYLILSDKIGSGDEELGKLLMKSLIYTLTQTKPFPNKILLLNSGVNLSTINDEIVQHLKMLEKEGTEVFSCGTCLNFYNLAEQLQVGKIGNMYDVVESITEKDVITIR